MKRDINFRQVFVAKRHVAVGKVYSSTMICFLPAHRAISPYRGRTDYYMQIRHRLGISGSMPHKKQQQQQQTIHLIIFYVPKHFANTLQLKISQQANTGTFTGNLDCCVLSL